MPLDPDVQLLVDTLAATNAPALSAGTVDEARRNYMLAPTPERDDLPYVVDFDVPGDGHSVAARAYADVAQPANLPVIVFIHGGGWVLSSIDGHDHFARRLARVSGALVVSVDYRLAPEHPFPSPHDDCWLVTRWLQEHAATLGGDGSRMIVAGDSAGGNLAAGVAIRARDEGLDLAAQVLIYPCTDTNQQPYQSMRDNATGFFLTAIDMAWFWNHYLADGGHDDPRAVPIQIASTKGLAPALVITAEFDPLRDEGAAYAQRLADGGVEVQYEAIPGVVHGFIARWHTMSRAHEVHAIIGDYCRAHLA